MYIKAMKMGEAMKMTTIDDDRQSRRRLSGVVSTTNKPRRHIISQEDTAQELQMLLRPKNRWFLVITEVHWCWDR